MNPPTLLYLPLCLWAAPESLLLGEGMPLTGRQPCKRAHNGSYRDLPASGYSCGKNPQSYTLTIQKLGLVLTALGGWLNKGNRLFPSSLKPLNIKVQQTSKGKNRLLLLWFSFNWEMSLIICCHCFWRPAITNKGTIPLFVLQYHLAWPSSFSSDVCSHVITAHVKAAIFHSLPKISWCKRWDYYLFENY